MLYNCDSISWNYNYNITKNVYLNYNLSEAYSYNLINNRCRDYGIHNNYLIYGLYDPTLTNNSHMIDKSNNRTFFYKIYATYKSFNYTL